MPKESDKTEELSPAAHVSEHRRSSSGGSTTDTVNESVHEPTSPTIESPSPVHTPDEKGDHDGGPLDPVRSTTSSMRPRKATPVPKEDRRGLLPWLSLTPEVDKPTYYNNALKWVLTSFVAIAASAAPMGSAILYPSLEEISAEFHVSATIVNLNIAVYLISMSIFPLWWSSFSETLGRRSIYLVSFALNAIFTAASGVSQNIAQLIVFRAFAGGAAASVQAVGAGTIADLWESRERGRAMSVFYLGPLTGPLLAPIIGGALTSSFGWRSTMYFLAVYGAVIFGLVLFGVPETLPRSHQEQKKAAAATLGDTSAPLSRTSTRRSVR
ncbi:hypothetical protein NPX13_g10579 [Xylaria arbuscula]|uniref:Major facilitator superfamily (MFS) profile domain-containing protein n=1 Tax=Xylaria arbuscula TaxID=114810 RepID=A0A9W8TGN1_9PEZI|nr:hypothetical protein NPX13_g10579 [Xylaria arbuscula]